jgi:hypothetical protein
MKRSLITGSLITVLVALVCISLAGTAFSQAPFDPTAHPKFVTLPPHNYFPNAQTTDPALQLQQWTFNWKSSWDNKNFSSVFVGTDPSQNNDTTTVTVAIIPIKMVYGSSNGNKTFDPSTPYVGKYSTTQIVALSPIFKPYFDYVQGGTDLGKTQYIDAYQRGNFWTDVMTNTNYHILLKTVIGPEQTFTVPSGQGSVISNPWSGIPTGTAEINWFDTQLQTVLTKYKTKITPNILPLFITENVYLIEAPINGCCIGGYHTANGGPPSGQTYSYSTVIQQASVPVFSQDVGALAHEVGEWLIDPFTQNASPCTLQNGILEIGDPLETETGVHDFGDWPYTVSGFTFHPQDLVFLSWFGESPSTAVNSWVTFQGTSLGTCQPAH